MFEYFLEDQVPTTEVSPNTQQQSQPTDITRDLF